jgi:hypothetical protein
MTQQGATAQTSMCNARRAPVQESPASKSDDTPRDNFQKAIEFYEPVVASAQAAGKLLAVPAVVVANLCVAYIMIEKNLDAEALMKQLEREEEAVLDVEPGKQARRRRQRPRGVACARHRCCKQGMVRGRACMRLPMLHEHFVTRGSS